MTYKLSHIDIEINHRCNLVCRHCSARAVKSKKVQELSISEIKNILNQAKDLGLKKVGLTGGEPLYDTKKLDIISHFCVDDLGVPIHTHTNGTLVNDEMCQQGGVLTLFESVSVTFLGGDKKTHDYMTKTNGSFKKAFKGAEIITKAGLPLTCYYIPTHGTINGFKKLTDKLKDIGVKRIRAMALAPSGRARPIYRETAPTQKELRKFQDDLLDSGKRLGIHMEAGYCTRLSMPGLSVFNGHDICNSGLNRVHINSKGDVFPCTAASGVKELNLGNLKNNGYNLKDIWYSSEKINLIRKVQGGSLSACTDCSLKQKCQFGCIVNACGTISEENKKICPLI